MCAWHLLIRGGGGPRLVTRVRSSISRDVLLKTYTLLTRSEKFRDAAAARERDPLSRFMLRRIRDDFVRTRSSACAGRARARHCRRRRSAPPPVSPHTGGGGDDTRDRPMFTAVGLFLRYFDMLSRSRFRFRNNNK